MSFARTIPSRVLRPVNGDMPQQAAGCGTGCCLWLFINVVNVVKIVNVVNVINVVNVDHVVNVVNVVNDFKDVDVGHFFVVDDDVDVDVDVDVVVGRRWSSLVFIGSGGRCRHHCWLRLQTGRKIGMVSSCRSN